MGDDINDIEILKNIELAGCPNDAIDSVKKVSDFISKKNGGCGAVREFCDYLLLHENITQ